MASPSSVEASASTEAAESLVWPWRGLLQLLLLLLLLPSGLLLHDCNEADQRVLLNDSWRAAAAAAAAAAASATANWASPDLSQDGYRSDILGSRL